jgi:nickel-type superoxide dismutase maturation protease
MAMAAECVGAALWLRWRFSRHEVRGDSMSPALRDGDWIVVDRKAYCGTPPRRGDIVLALDPREPSRTLVKRVDDIDLHGNAGLLGDNLSQSTDSRDFGAVAASAIIGRVRWRYWPLGRRIH